MQPFIFPSWTDKLTRLFAAVCGGAVLYAVAVGAYGTAPSTVNVGYSPEQPVPFSHRVHAGQLGIDCRYCHHTADKAAHAALPATETCTKCHSAANSDGTTMLAAIHSRSPKLLPVRESQATGDPIPWERIHDLPDYAYFNHSAHVNRGVGCASCHGRIDQMEQVYQAETLSMAWCLECHREPEKHLRPLDKITDMDWAPENQEEVGRRIKEELSIKASTNCSTCHR